MPTFRTRSGRSRRPDRPKRAGSRRAGRERPRVVPTPSRPAASPRAKASSETGFPSFRRTSATRYPTFFFRFHEPCSAMKIWPRVLRGEHSPLVEAHAERRDMRAQLQRGRDEVAARELPAELRIGHVAAVAIRESEVETLARCAVQLVGRAVVAEPVASVVREPKLLRVRMPVEADRVSHAARDDLEAGPVGPETRDRRVRIAPPADVARSADRNVEKPVGAERDELPAVVRVLRERVRDDGGSRRIPEPSLDAVEAQKARDLHDVQRAVLHGHAVRLAQVLRERENFVGARPIARVHERVDGARVAGPDEERPARDPSSSSARRERRRCRRRS